jgi:hypothetical protein
VNVPKTPKQANNNLNENKNCTYLLKYSIQIGSCG